MTETVKQMLQALAAADNEVATARGELKAAEERYQAICDRVFAFLDEQGMDSARAPDSGLQVRIEESEVFSFEDMEKFTAFVLRHKATELFQRRLSAPAVRALIESRGGKPIPGLGSFTKRRLSVTKAK